MRTARLATGAAFACALVVAAAASGASAPLPGGTSLDLEVTSPAEGTTLPEAPVTFTGTAAVGKGAPVANTLLIYVIDVSASTAATQPTTLCGNQNKYDLVGNTTLDCELLAIKTANDAAVASGTVSRVGLVAYGGAIRVGSADDAAALDLSPDAGVQSLVPPGAATFAPPTLDLDSVLQSAWVDGAPLVLPAGLPTPPPGTDGFARFTMWTTPGNTNFWAALTAARAIAAGSSAPNKLVLFMSDGVSNRGGPAGQNVSDALAGISGVEIDTFAVGPDSTCTGGTFGSLQQIAAATGGTCQVVPNVAGAVTAVPAAIASQLSSVTTTVDGGAPAVPTVAPSLPQTGPSSVDWTQTLPLAAGAHTLCAQAAATDSGGAGQVQDCVHVTVKAKPTVSVGATAATTNEGAALTVSGSASDGSVTWSEPSGHCTFADAHAASTTVTCDDDGVYALSFTADDGVNRPVSATETVTVDNVAPTPTLTLSPGPHALGSIVTATVAIADPGAADTETCSFAWGDGSAGDTVAATGRSCSAQHAYGSGGSMTVKVTVTDDDGGSGTDSLPLVIDTPPTVTTSDASGNEGSPIALLATAVDDLGTPTLQWTAVPGANVAAGAACTFADPAAASTTVTCTDDGTWTITLTASDGVNPPVSQSATLTVANVAPTVTITSPAAGFTGRNVAFTATVADPGANNTLSCSVDWGDGSAPETIAVSGGSCAGTHAYAAGLTGATVTVRASDDDGGSGSDSRALSFNRPPVCSTVRAFPPVLWPPNGRFRLVRLRGASDPDGDRIAYTIMTVTQDEPLGSGRDNDERRWFHRRKPQPDAVRVGGPLVLLRAARDPRGDGRVYTIGFTVTDAFGASCAGTATVGVPRDPRHPARATFGVAVDSFGS